VVEKPPNRCAGAQPPFILQTSSFPRFPSVIWQNRADFWRNRPRI
jgi:hypothetical protein